MEVIIDVFLSFSKEPAECCLFRGKFCTCIINLKIRKTGLWWSWRLPIFQCEVKRNCFCISGLLWISSLTIRVESVNAKHSFMRGRTVESSIKSRYLFLYSFRNFVYQFICRTSRCIQGFRFILKRHVTHSSYQGANAKRHLRRNYFVIFEQDVFNLYFNSV